MGFIWQQRMEVRKAIIPDTKCHKNEEKSEFKVTIYVLINYHRIKSTQSISNEWSWYHSFQKTMFYQMRKKSYIFEYQSNENRAFRFFFWGGGDTRYIFIFTAAQIYALDIKKKNIPTRNMGFSQPAQSYALDIKWENGKKKKLSVHFVNQMSLPGVTIWNHLLTHLFSKSELMMRHVERILTCHILISN